MAKEDEGKTDPEKTDPEKTDPPEDDAAEDDAADEGEGDKVTVDPELAKAIKRRDAANAAKNKALEEVAALKAKYEKDKTDPVAVANGRLVKAEARTVLTASGVPKEDQAAVMGYLKLEDIQVSSDGEVDTDAIQDAVDHLKKIFGKAAPTKRVPTIDPKDRSGTAVKPADAASARRRAMLQGN